jgi:hypothetical protein
MPRPYSDAFLRDLSRSQSDGLGVELAKACVDANLAAVHVALALEVSRNTVYSWFRGQGVHENKRKRIESLISLIKTDTKEGLLPARSVKEAKQYISSIIGTPVQ